MNHEARVLLQKLTVAQMVKKSPHFIESKGRYSVHKSQSRNPNLSQLNPVQTLQIISFRCVLITPFHTPSAPKRISSSQLFPYTFLLTVHLRHAQFTCPHPILNDTVNLATTGEDR